MLGPTSCVLYLLASLVLDLRHGRSSSTSTGSLVLAAPTAPTADFGWLTTDEPEWLPRNLTAPDVSPFAEEQQEVGEELSKPPTKSEKSVLLSQDSNNVEHKPGEGQVRAAASR